VLRKYFLIKISTKAEKVCIIKAGAVYESKAPHHLRMKYGSDN